MSFVGVYLVARPDVGGLLAGRASGELLIVAAGVCTAVGSVFAQRFSVDLPLATRQA